LPLLLSLSLSLPLPLPLLTRSDPLTLKNLMPSECNLRSQLQVDYEHD